MNVYVNTSVHQQSCLFRQFWTLSLWIFWSIKFAQLSTEGQKALRFHQKYLNLCSEDERKICGFGTTWGRV